MRRHSGLLAALLALALGACSVETGHRVVDAGLLGQVQSYYRDFAIEQGGAKVVVDGMSLMYLLGCELDYVEDLTGSYFRVNNPNATASCGCGNSFAV